MPLLPMSSSTTPFQASRPASVTTNDGTPTFVMISAVQQADAEAARAARCRSRRAAGSSLPSGSSSSAVSTPPTPDTKPIDRSISPSSSTKVTPMAITAYGRGLDDQVDEVARGEEAVVLRLEDDRDDDQADDDRQRAELARLDVGPPAARVRADGVLGRCVGLERAVRRSCSCHRLLAGDLGERAGGDRLDHLLLVRLRPLVLGHVLAEAQDGDLRRRPRRCRAGCARSGSPRGPARRAA